MPSATPCREATRVATSQPLRKGTQRVQVSWVVTSEVMIVASALRGRVPGNGHQFFRVSGST
jgi:hypothetical protein